jgi:hypothetical protein
VRVCVCARAVRVSVCVCRVRLGGGGGLSDGVAVTRSDTRLPLQYNTWYPSAETVASADRTSCSRLNS